VFVASGGVGDGGEDEGQRAAVEAGREVTEVDGVPVGDAGGGVQHVQLAAAAHERPGGQGRPEVGPGMCAHRPSPSMSLARLIRSADYSWGSQRPKVITGRRAASSA
jgi:hypothetical protein